MEWLANLSWRVVVPVVALFGVIRLVLGRYRSRPARVVAETAESLAVALAIVYLVIKPFLVQAFFIPTGSMIPTLLERDHIMVNKLVYRIGEPRLGDIVVFEPPTEALQGRKQVPFIKRVIGLPGDTLEVRPGYVTIGPAQYRHFDLRRYLRSCLPRYTSLDDVEVRLRSDGVYLEGQKLTRRQVAIAVGDPDAPVRIHPGYVLRNGKPVSEPYLAEDPDEPMGPTKVPPRELFVMGDNRNRSHDSRAWGFLDRKRVLGRAMFIFWPARRIGWLR